MSKPTIACLGPQGSFSEHTLLATLGHQSMHIKFVADLRELLTALEQHTADYIWLPWWNSGCGFLQDSHQQEFLLSITQAQHHYKIVADDFTYLKFALLGLPHARISDIKTIFTNPYAPSICKKFFSEYIHAEIIIKNSSSEAAKALATAKNHSIAALANLQSAQLYGLHVLRETTVAPDEEAMMHFILLTHRETPVSLVTKGDYFITSCIVRSDDKKTLLDSQHVNIHALRSSATDANIHLLDLDGHIEETALKDLLGKQLIRYLGYYPRMRK